MIAAIQTKGYGRGKSGLRRAGCQITSGGGDSQDSATEIYRVSNEAGDRDNVGHIHACMKYGTYCYGHAANAA